MNLANSPTFTNTDAPNTDGVKAYPYKVAIVAPTCFYYQEPIFRELAAHPRINLTVYFCSKEALNARDVQKLYRSSSSWGLEEEFLSGYKYKFLANYSPVPSYLRWPAGLMNPGILRELSINRPDAVIIMGWNNPTWWMALLGCLFLKIPILYMTDANVQAEISQRLWKALFKKIVLGKVFFPVTTGFLSSGKANDILYEYYGVSKEKVVPFAYSMVHQSFLPVAEELGPQRSLLRAQLGIPQDSFVVLYCGRFVKQKGALDLLKAYIQIDSPKTELILVGDGEFRPPLETFVAENKLKSVCFYGFRDRTEIGKFYAISDVLVLPSWRETWGMVVNEALCFSLPVIVSDQVGARDDLVIDGYNGFTFPVGDTSALAGSIRRLMEMPLEDRQEMGARSLELIKQWSEKDVSGSLVQYLDHIRAQQAPLGRRGTLRKPRRN